MTRFYPPNASSVTKSDTVNPMPASAPAPSTYRKVTPCGSLPIRSATASIVNRVTPTVLPITRPRMTPQREDRHDDERRVRMEQVFEPLDDRHRLARVPRHPVGARERRPLDEFVGVDVLG